jgi:hypothetical protein
MYHLIFTISYNLKYFRCQYCLIRHQCIVVNMDQIEPLRPSHGELAMRLIRLGFCFLNPKFFTSKKLETTSGAGNMNIT